MGLWVERAESSPSRRGLSAFPERGKIPSTHSLLALETDQKKRPNRSWVSPYINNLKFTDWQIEQIQGHILL
jgi:hypothetical protein